MAELTIRPVSESDAVAWERLVLSAKHSTFFHRWGWRDLLCKGLGYSDHYLCATRGGSIIGILPLVGIRSRLFGTSLTSLPFCSYAGPLAAQDDDGQDVTRALVNAAIQLAERLRVRRVELRNLQSVCPKVPAQRLYSTFRAPIPLQIESMQGIPQKRRNVIRRAVSLGLQTQVNQDTTRFFELYAENARAHGTPALGRPFFRNLIQVFQSECDILFVTDSSGTDLSAILNFYHHGEVLAYFAGEVEAARGTNANDFKYWSLMLHAKGRGCSAFDFGRSKAGTGSFQFKKLWGFEPHVLLYEFPYLPSGEVPQNNPMNPKYKVAMEIWKRLPRAVVDRLGPKLVGGLG